MGKIEVKCFALNDFAQGVFKIGKQNEYASNLLPKEVANVDKGKNGKYYVSSYLNIIWLSKFIQALYEMLFFLYHRHQFLINK